MKLNLSILVLISTTTFFGCSSPPPKAVEHRDPASDATYPLNPKFEQLLANEDQDIFEIRDGMLRIQSDEQKAHGKYLRGTHAKGTCVGGQMEIYDVEKSAPTVASRLKKGMFSVPGKYSADVRFANADGSINPDHERDVRAVSFSLHMPPALSNPQGRMDFTMNDATTFPLNDAQVFADLMRTKLEGLKKAESDVGPEREGNALWEEVDGSFTQERLGRTPYQKARYWSTVPFALGEDEAVKYSLKPCKSNHAERLNYKNPDELRNELIRNVTKDSKMSCFEFGVQLLEPTKMHHLLHLESATWWVENAATEWPESEAPFYPVGKLTLVANSVIDPNVCESRWINVIINNNAIHHGIGSINRARSTAEQASKEKRLGQ